MGYTHYMSNIHPCMGLADDAIRIVDQAREEGLSICGPHGYDDPIITPARIALNGSADRDEDYETFVIEERNPNVKYHPNDFCKTARQPYDAVCTAILIAATTHGDEVGSDGSLTDWIDSGGVSLYERAIAPLTARQVLTIIDMIGDGMAGSGPNADSLARCSETVRTVASAFSNPRKVDIDADRDAMLGIEPDSIIKFLYEYETDGERWKRRSQYVIARFVTARKLDNGNIMLTTRPIRGDVTSEWLTSHISTSYSDDTPIVRVIAGV